MRTSNKGFVSSEAVALVVALFFACLVFLVVGYSVNDDTKHDSKHKAVIYRLKNHHIVMKDDSGRWWEYVLKNNDIDFDIPVLPSGEMKLPSGGSWRQATQEEEEEVSETESTEQTSVDESSDGAPDGSGNVGGDSGGNSGSDSSSDGGDGGGGGDGGD